MPKLHRHGQAAIISDSDYAKIRKQLRSPKYRLLLDIARYTGERWGAIVQLRVEDVFDFGGKERDYITFRARTRKAAPSGLRQTRQVPMHPQLKELVAAIEVPAGPWLFPSGDHHITLRAADAMLRGALAKAGLEHKGYSTHSTRRTFITRLYERGIDLRTIQLITGHHDLQSLIRYVETDPQRAVRAIAVL